MSQFEKKELHSIFSYCPIQTVINAVYINKKCRKSIEEGNSNSQITQAVSKKETKLFSHTDILKGRMTDLVHALSLKNWKKRTLRYASFEITFLNWHDYSKHKLYHDIAKDVRILHLESNTKTDDLLMMLKTSTNLRKLIIPCVLCNKLNTIYPMEHLLKIFKLEILKLTAVDMNKEMNGFYSYLECLENVKVILECSTINFKHLQELRMHKNVICTVSQLKENDFQILPFIQSRKVYLQCPLFVEWNKYEEYEQIEKNYLPPIQSVEMMNVSSLILRGAFKLNVLNDIQTFTNLKYFCYDETKKGKKLKTIDLSSLELRGITFIGNDMKRQLSLPTSLKELEIHKFCSSDSIISPIGTTGFRTLTTVTKLVLDSVSGVIIPPRDINVINAFHCTIGKIDTKEYKFLHSLSFEKVKIEELIIFEKIDYLNLNTVTGIRSVDYKNDCYYFKEKEEKNEK